MHLLRWSALAGLLFGSACSKQAPTHLALTPGCNPFATTSECLFPFPSSFFQAADASAATGVRVNYPDGTFGASSTGTVVDVAPYNAADGAPPVSPLLAFFAADVDLSLLPGQHQLAQSVAKGSPLALIDLATGARVPCFAEMEANRSPSARDRYALIIRPMAPMQMGHRHAVVLSDAVKLASGAALPVSPAFAALRDGESTDSEVIEAVRDRYEQIFMLAGQQGIARAHVALAWDFMVASESYLLGPIRAMRAQALLEAGDAGQGYAGDGGLAYTIDSIKQTAAGGELVEGTFQVTNYINAKKQFSWDANHLPIQQPRLTPAPDYTMYIPAADLADGGTPLPVGIFGHGLLGTGRGYLDTGSVAPVIQGMAERAGTVLIATDWTGLSGTQDDEVVGLTVATNINQLGQVTDRLAQSLINNLALTKLARGPLSRDARIAPQGHALVDLSRTLYYGVSLGGIQGASLVSISDEISRGILAVPGAGWATMFPRSVDWLQFQTYALPTYPDPLQQTELLALMQARFDFTDSANLTRMLLAEPLAGAPAKTVLLQEAIADCQVPNLSTELLARAIGVQQLTPAYATVFGLDAVDAGTSSSALAQYVLPSDVAIYLPPDTDTAALQDNGAHFDLNLLPNAQQQIIDFLHTGIISQSCSGVCDPN